MPEKDMKDLLRVQGVDVLGYGKIPKAVMQDRRLTVTAKAIYAYFSSFAGAGTSAFPSVEKACYDLGINRPETFIKHRKNLEQYGYVTVEQIREKGKFARNIYTLETKPKEPPITVLSDTVETEPIETVTIKPYSKNNSIKNNRSKNNTNNNAAEKSVVVNKTQENFLIKTCKEIGCDIKLLTNLVNKYSFPLVQEKLEMAKRARVSRNINGWLKEAVERDWKAKAHQTSYKTRSHAWGLEKENCEEGSDKFADIYIT